MPRLNIYLPEHYLEQWELIDNKSKWIQQKLDEEWKRKKAEEKSL